MASSHVLHSLHHVGVRPVSPASAVVSLVAHGDLDTWQDTAGQHRSHARKSETAVSELNTSRATGRAVLKLYVHLNVDIIIRFEYQL